MYGTWRELKASNVNLLACACVTWLVCLCSEAMDTQSTNNNTDSKNNKNNEGNEKLSSYWMDRIKLAKRGRMKRRRSPT